MGVERGGKGRRGPERAVTVPEQNVDSPGGAGNSEVDLAVAVEVARRDVTRISAGRVIHLRLKRAVAVAEHDADRARDPIIDNRHIVLAVTVKVGHGQIIRTRACRVTHGGEECRHVPPFERIEIELNPLLRKRAPPYRQAYK